MWVAGINKSKFLHKQLNYTMNLGMSRHIIQWFLENATKAIIVPVTAVWSWSNQIAHFSGSPPPSPTPAPHLLRCFAVHKTQLCHHIQGQAPKSTALSHFMSWHVNTLPHTWNQYRLLLWTNGALIFLADGSWGCCSSVPQFSEHRGN